MWFSPEGTGGCPTDLERWKSRAAREMSAQPSRDLAKPPFRLNVRRVKQYLIHRRVLDPPEGA